MNWIILIIAGLCETGFAFCLGKTKLAVGTEFWVCFAVCAECHTLSQSNADYSDRSGISCVDWYRGSRRSVTRSLCLP